MYGSQPPPQQPYHPSGPPQPEWQAPPSYQDQQSWHLPSSPPPPASGYNPNTYGPMPGNAPTPVHNAAPSPATDTARWGVRYNQMFQGGTQGHPAPPPLPPRPSSAANQSQAHPFQSPVAQSPATGASPWAVSSPQDYQQPYSQPSAPPPPTAQYQQSQQWHQDPSQPQQWHQDSSQAFGGYHSQVPPVPETQQPWSAPERPPIPPAYQAELQQTQQQGWNQQPHYSTHPPTHHYDPQLQPQPPPVGPSAPTDFHDTSSLGYGGTYGHNAPPGTATSQAPTAPSAASVGPPHLPVQHHDPGFGNAGAAFPQTMTSSIPNSSTPVSPPTTGASALGFGGPSDWEHLGSMAADIDDTKTFGFKHGYSSQAPPPSASDSVPVSSPTVSSPAQQSSVQAVSPIPAVAAVAPQAPQVQPEKSPPHPVTNDDIRNAPSPPSGPIRMDSVASTGSSISYAGDTGTIDNVIAAWKGQVLPEQDLQPNEVIPETPVAANVVQTPTSAAPSNPVLSSPKPASNEQSVVKEVKEDIVPKVKIVDPYEDLDPWYRSSLTRFVNMLRKEAVAESDQERYKIFTSFCSKESKLREVLYNIEVPEEPSSKMATQGQKDSVKDTAADVAQDSARAKPLPTTTVPSKDATSIAKSDAEPMDDGAYSPGGRPILSFASTTPPAAGIQGLQRSTSLQSRNVDAVGPSNSAEPVELSASVSRSTSVPPGALDPSFRNPVLDIASATPPRPVYTPFRYSEAPPSSPLSSEPAHQNYSALRQASATSGRVMAHQIAPGRDRLGAVDSPAPRHEHDETFLGLIREKSVAYRKNRPSGAAPPMPSLSVSSPKVALNAILKELRSLIPDPIPSGADAQNKADRREIGNFADDFGFIKMRLESWEKDSRGRREALDRQRQSRQEESERNIDGLFHDKEIGYSDINPLEEEFRKKETKIQLEEERQLFGDYVATVFETVDNRLKGEISRLKELYERILRRLESEVSAGNRSSGHASAERYQLSHTVENVMAVFQKLELRFQRRLDAGLECERQRKKAERRPLVFAGDSRALKQLDKEFEQMEKQNILEAAKDRDDRANRLMDSFDDAIMGGLGQNQSLLDEIAAKVHKIDRAMLEDTGSDTPAIEKTLHSVSSFVEFLGKDSESILHSFGIADRALNDADYNVSVSQARLSKSNAEIFRRLDEEKSKEDRKIEGDVRTRLGSIKKAPQEIVFKVKGLLDSIESSVVSKLPIPVSPTDRGDEAGPTYHPGESLMPGPSPSPAPVQQPDSEEEERKERLRKALEAAKRRNAAKGLPT